ncbi:hypothetical protein GCM10017786_75730 [Amycolatopsis deserti]|uniref:Uncharacterized protein n=1 Tax=Amycolatopsis deserti TaxID=185696 RepID=A0ABQ3JMB7_9PSEU|nr:hypothetical protein GCM10017786_75730 [Amycolatopsis deserti]
MRTRPEITCAACRAGGCGSHGSAWCDECGGEMTTAHVHLDYVGHAAVTARLLDVDPEWNWEPMALTPEGLPAIQDGCLWIRLTIGGVTRIGVGDAPQQRGGRARKEAIGDAIRNAAMRFGVALDMWMGQPDPPADPAPADPPPTADPAVAERDERGDANDLRGRIRDITKGRGRSASQTAADFTKWSKKGTQFLRASRAELAEYLDHLLQHGGKR